MLPETLKVYTVKYTVQWGVRGGWYGAPEDEPFSQKFPGTEGELKQAKDDIADGDMSEMIDEHFEAPYLSAVSHTKITAGPVTWTEKYAHSRV